MSLLLDIFADVSKNWLKMATFLRKFMTLQIFTSSKTWKLFHP